ncbi:MAG: tetratricopeptide repeat protein [Puniceicoccales bacterium]|jgi:tetratricopeptide (TPR) repeat protein|nr:tetratricopeptide repeat protein [Puniceicoccales bacterium]
MSKPDLAAIDSRLSKQVTAAENAYKGGNAQYAAEIAQSVLVRVPEAADVRALMHKAQRAVHGAPKKSFFGGFAGLSGIFSAKAVAANPRQAIENAEKNLAKNPYDIAALRMLAAAAEKLEWFETVALAHAELAALEPKDPSHPVAQANALFRAKELDEALRVTDEALQRFPGNGDLQELARRTSVAKTVEKGKWDEGSDFKSKTKDLAGAAKTEAGARLVQDAEEAVKIAAELEVKIAADPQNVDLYREAVRNYHAAGNLEKAIETLDRARQTNLGRADAALEKLQNEYTMELNDKYVEAYAERAKNDPGNAQFQAEYEQAKTSARDYRLSIYQSLVDRYPNDYGYRYNLGVLLLEAGRNGEAIQQLQIAQRNPKSRQNAMLNLARAFTRGNKFDLAVEQLIVAKGEIQVMTDIKKEIIYELGSAYEKLGKKKEAADEFKALYMSDATYKDVAQKIEAAYQ